MVKEGGYIDFILNLPKEIGLSTEMGICKDLAVAIKELMKENELLKERLTIIENKLKL